MPDCDSGCKILALVLGMGAVGIVHECDISVGSDEVDVVVSVDPEFVYC